MQVLILNSFKHKEIRTTQGPFINETLASKVTMTPRL